MAGSRRRAVARRNPSTWLCAIWLRWRRSLASSLSVLPSTRVYPAAARASSAPRTIGGKNGLVMSGTSMPTASDRRVLSALAMPLTW